MVKFLFFVWFGLFVWFFFSQIGYGYGPDIWEGVINNTLIIIFFKCCKSGEEKMDTILFDLKFLKFKLLVYELDRHFEMLHATHILLCN